MLLDYHCDHFRKGTWAFFVNQPILDAFVAQFPSGSMLPNLEAFRINRIHSPSVYRSLPFLFGPRMTDVTDKEL